MAKPRGKSFPAGNTEGHGRPRGSRNRVMEATQELFDEHAVPVAKKCILMAIRGDRTALQLAIERLLPPCKSAGVQFDMPAIRTLADLPEATNALMQAISTGKITAGEGQQVMALLAGIRGNLETLNFDRRLREIEQRQEKRKHEAGGDETAIT
jgi:hypothetical protein